MSNYLIFVACIINCEYFQLSRASSLANDSFDTNLILNDSLLVINKNLDTNSFYYYNNNKVFAFNQSINNTKYNSYELTNCIEDCRGFGFGCVNYECKCLEDYEPVRGECKGKYDAFCKNNSHCLSEKNLECDRWATRCVCKTGYTYDTNNELCIYNYNTNYDSKTAMQIYKITMIFASCCLALILMIFLVCILRKSYCPPRRQIVPLDNTLPDIFTLFPHVAGYDGGPLADGTQPPFEKPPTYDETIQLMRHEVGVPPPAYRVGNSPGSSNSSTPEMSSLRVLIARPSLMTVNRSETGNSNSNRLSNSDTNSQTSNDAIAGPSGYQGFVNHAFSNV